MVPLGHKAVREGLEEELCLGNKKGTTTNLQPGRNKGSYENKHYSHYFPPLFLPLMALKLTKARGQEGGANHPRANGAGCNWVATDMKV